MADQTITIGAGAVSATATFKLTPKDDTTDEPTETISLDGASGSLAVTDTEIALMDDEETSVALARAGTGFIAESGGSEDITLTLGRALVTGESVTVPLVVSGAAVTSHYTLGLKAAATGVKLLTGAPHDAQNPALVFTGPSASSATLTLTAVNNTDTTERTVSIAYGASAQAPSSTGLDGGISTSGSPVVVPIADDDAQITIADASAAEGSPVVFTVTLPGAAPAGGVTIDYATSDGRGEATDEAWQVATSADYTAAANDASITIATGQSAGSISVATTGDSTYEGDHYFTVELTGTSRMSIDSTAGSALGTITDAADTPVFALSSATGAVDENDGTITLTVSKTGTSLVASTVDYATADGTAKAGEDYTTKTGTLSFAAADTSKTFEVAIADDVIDEAAETFAVALTAGDHAQLGAVKTQTVTIADDDVPVVTIAAKNAAAVTEGAAVVFTLTANPAPAADLTVNLSVADAPNADFVAAGNQDAGKTVTIEAGETEAEYAVATVGGPSETADEPDGEVTVTVTESTADPVDYEVGATAEAGIEVRDNDATVVTLAVPDATATEESFADTASLTLTLGRALRAGESLTVPLQFAGGVLGADFRLFFRPAAGVVVLANRVIFSGSAAGSATEATIPLSASADDDAVNDTVTVSIPVSDTRSDPEDTSSPILTATGLRGGVEGKRDGNGVIAVTDDDKVGLTLAPIALAVPEGASRTYTVALATEPTATVMVTVASNNTDVTVDTDSATNGPQNTLTFTTTNWYTGRTVKVTAGQDDDAANDTLTLTHAASGGDYGAVTKDLVVTVTDNDTPGVTITQTDTDTAVTEASGETNTDTYTVVLDTEPTHDVTVKVTAPSGLLVDGPDADSTGSATDTLTFTTTHWNTAQTVTVYGVDDRMDQGTRQSLTITHEASSTDTDYDEIVIADVDVAVTDNDEAGLTLTPDALTVTEGANGIYRVKLATEPSANVTVTVTVGTGGDVTVNKAGGAAGNSETLTFTTTNWNRAQIVEVIADNDADTTDDTVALTHTAAGGGYDSVTADLMVTVRDDEAPVVSIARKTVQAVEGDAAVFTVTANPAPTANLTVNLTVTDAANADFVAVGDQGTGKTVMILSGETSADYSVATVNDSGANADEPDGAVTVTVVSGAHYRVGTADAASIWMTDNDATVVTLAVTDAEAEEESGTDTASLRLTLGRALRAGESLSAPFQFAGGVLGTDFSLSLSGTPVGVKRTDQTVTFTGSPTGSATEATILLSALADDDAVSDRVTVSIPSSSASEEPILILSATGLGGGAEGKRIGNGVITVTDDDEPALTLEPTSLTVTEGAIGTYTVALATKPSAEVTVTVTAGAGDVTVNQVGGTAGSSQALTFTTTDWDTAQTVTVIAGEDDDAANDEATLTHTAAGGDYASVEQDLVVTVDDDDTPGVTITETGTPSATVVTEASGDGNTDTYTVVLDTEPTHTVTVTVTAPSGLLVDGPDAGETETLTFTTGNSGNWNTAQTVTVYGEDDRVDQGTERSLSITHAAASDDPAYDEIAIAGVTVTVTDDDEAGLTLTPDSLTVAEGGTHTYTVKLSSQPTGDVTVTIAGAGDVTVDTDSVTDGAQTKLTFSPTATATLWSTARTVTVTAGQDNDVVGDTATLGHTASGGGYALVTKNLVVTVTDDDEPSVSVADAAAVAEGNDPAKTTNMTFAVSLSAVSDKTVTVPYTLSGEATAGADYTEPDPLSVTIVAGGQSADITIPVKGDEIDEIDETVTVTLGAPTNATVSTAQGAGTASGAITDDDTRGVVISEASVSVRESDDTTSQDTREDQATYTVKLASEPVGGAVTIAVASADTDAATVSPVSLVFSASNWNTAKIVTVSGVDDDIDNANDRRTTRITHGVSASGTDYSSVTAAPVSVTVNDDDGPPTGVTLSVDPASVGEVGGAREVTVTATAVGGSTFAESKTVRVTVGAAADSAKAPADYAAVSAFDVTIAAGAPSGTQTFTLTPVDDDIDEGAGETISVSGALSGFIIAPVNVTLTDDDDRGVKVTPRTLTLDEVDKATTPGTTENVGTYDVVLDSQPTGAVTVNLSNSDASVVSLNKTSLSFNATNWSTAQTVTVTAIADAFDNTGDKRTATITHTVSAVGTDYAGETADPVVVTVTDDDDAPTRATLTVSPSPPYRKEAGPPK